MSKETDALLDRLSKFMDEHIYPNEEVYAEQLASMPNRFGTVPLMESQSGRTMEPVVAERSRRHE